MDWKPLMDQITATLVPDMGVLIATVIAILFAKLNEWLKDKIKNEKVEAAVLQITASAESSVNEIEATTRRFMSDGHLSVDEIATLKEMASKMVQNQVPKAVEVLVNAGMENVKQFVGGKVEQAVAAMPAKEKAG